MLTVGAAVSQWAEMIRIARGVGRVLANCRKNVWVGPDRIGKSGAPWERNRDGRDDMVLSFGELGAEGVSAVAEKELDDGGYGKEGRKFPTTSFIGK